MGGPCSFENRKKSLREKYDSVKNRRVSDDDMTVKPPGRRERSKVEGKRLKRDGASQLQLRCCFFLPLLIHLLK
ncbi:hypothetical protein AXX17_AT4G31790 [Arabidopsis thaliana]|jgi:hypothetical protein|uniref:Uncharacterized protein n=1 Tax=Arabidopsis thaliana TaxID=3702 RepID=A0A178UYY9_ARATH|nr:hypothetical protein AXX17_AT4G31790 [Arabidopsis thaliana]